MARSDIPTSRLAQRLQQRIYGKVYREYVIESGGRVLEVGCGEHPIKGVSCPTDKEIAKGRIRRADVLHLPFKDKEFDLVIARNFIGCFDCIRRPDLKRKALREMRRVGKVVFVREFNKKLCPAFWRARLVR